MERDEWHQRVYSDLAKGMEGIREDARQAREEACRDAQAMRQEIADLTSAQQRQYKADTKLLRLIREEQNSMNVKRQELARLPRDLQKLAITQREKRQWTDLQAQTSKEVQYAK